MASSSDSEGEEQPGGSAAEAEPLERERIRGEYTVHFAKVCVGFN